MEELESRVFALLRKIQWKGDFSQKCPCCGADGWDAEPGLPAFGSHDANCDLANLMAECGPLVRT